MCSSVVQLMVILLYITFEVLTKTDHNKYVINIEIRIYIFHLISHHLWDAFQVAITRLVKLTVREYYNLTATMIIYGVIGVGMSLVSVSFSDNFVPIVDNTFTMDLNIINHITSFHIVALKGLMDFLFNRIFY